MSICDHCSYAVRNLRPHDDVRLNGESVIYVLLPRYQRLSDVNCWICYKFFIWLELEDPTVLEIWRKESLPVTFHSYARMQVRKPGSGPLLAPLAIEISPTGCTEYDLGCEVMLNFITAEELTESESIALDCGDIAVPNFELVRTWYNLCTRHHTKCKTFSNQWFPTRLIYLGSQDCEPKLIISEGNPPNGLYMSLSHRWGSQKYTKLESTITQLQSAIHIDTLPQVFQEAIKLARFLGIDYIWIGALCIKQDPGLSDWKVESLNMGKVYSQAVLNVSATLSHDGSESLFQQQPRALFPLPKYN